MLAGIGLRSLERGIDRGEDRPIELLVGERDGVHHKVALHDFTRKADLTLACELLYRPPLLLGHPERDWFLLHSLIIGHRLPPFRALDLVTRLHSIGCARIV